MEYLYNYITLFSVIFLVIDNCASSPCQYGSTCKPSNEINRYTCTCAAGYTGTKCEICEQLLIVVRIYCVQECMSFNAIASIHCVHYSE